MLEPKILPAILIIASGIAVTAHPTSIKAASHVCKAKPDTAPPTGSRWQYRVNPVDQHRCWFLSSRNLSAPSRIGVASRRAHSSAERDVNALSPHREKFKPEAEVAQATKAEIVLTSDQSAASDERLRPKELPASVNFIPKAVATISYSVRPAAEAATPVAPLSEVKRGPAQSLHRVGETSLMFFGVAFATALLVAGLVFQIIGRLRQVRVTHPPHEVSRYTNAGQHAVANPIKEAVPTVSLTRAESFKHAPARSDSINDLKSKMDQWVLDLQNSKARVSFASHPPLTEPTHSRARGLLPRRASGLPVKESLSRS
jgi:hypothetical protein